MSAAISVIGAGTMGAGIAQVAAIHGYQTTLCDVSSDQLESALGAIEASVEKGIAKGKTPESARELVKNGLRTESDLEKACAGSEIVIEAVPEKVELKRSIFGQVESVVSSDAILATNTSSIPIRDLAGSLKNPARFVGMHFFNPVPVMSLIEIIRGEQTSDATIDRSVEFAAKLAKEPIVVKDSPGFATSRLGLVIG
ncbi:MAG: 3-hydroxybutyryl-CoA dehydrogenase, partial [Planctomycetia bacterium TMED53]